MEGLWGMDLFLFLCCFLLGQHRNIKYRKKQKRVGAVLLPARTFHGNVPGSHALAGIMGWDTIF